MKPGRRPKPTHLKLVAGNPGRRALNDNEPEPEGDLVQPPAWFTDKQKDAWRYAIEHAPRGLLKHIDSDLLSIWVCAKVLHQEANEKVSRHGMIVKAPNTGVPMQNPYLAIVNKQSAIMMKAAAELGFTPSSRSQIAVTPKKRNAFSNNGRRLHRAPTTA